MQDPEKSPEDSKFSCNECRRRRIKCSRDIPACFLCEKYRRHCLYEKHSKTPLTRKHLTEVEEELSFVKELLRLQNPSLDVSNLLSKLKNGYDVAEVTLESRKRLRLTPETGVDTLLQPLIERLLEEDKDLQIPQLISPILDSSVAEKRPPKAEISPKSNYHWDERKLGEAEEPTIIDGMATTETNSYLGAASSAALINLVGGGFFLVDEKPPSPVLSSASSNPSSCKEIPKSKIEHYLNQYFETFHVSYPIIHKPLFMAQVHEIVTPPTSGWDSLVNIVAAIGSFMSAVSPEENDDLKLFEMSKSNLSIEDLETGNITLVQTLTLMSNYLQKRDRPNSGYNYLGLAVRMALGLGLHKHVEEDDTYSKQDTKKDSLLNQETNRRVWWCLYIFDCGQTITYGRPLGIPCAGIDCKLPLNILDSDLTSRSTSLPNYQHNSPTIYTSVRLQSLFHLLTNSIYDRIITDPFPSSAQLLKWDEQYLQRWRNMVPEYFLDNALVSQEYLLCHAVLQWRYKNFRIIMYRTFLLKNFIVGSDPKDEKDLEAGEICLQECSATIRSMDSFWNRKLQNNRMDAWYSLYFLIPAVLMPLVCLRNEPTSLRADEWRQDIHIAKSIIERLIGMCPTAIRITNLIESLGSQSLTDSVNFSTEDSPTSQLIQLHSMLWPTSFDIEQQFL